MKSGRKENTNQKCVDEKPGKSRKFLFYPVHTHKDKVKVVRTCLEYLFIFAVVFAAARSLLVYKRFVPYDRTDSEIVSGEDHGFVALSYFGVARNGTDSLISVKRLEEELASLKDLGYVTVTQKDIEEYYKEGKPLPDKSLFLLFEDGRTDTVLFAEKLLEKLNDKASVLTYAEKFENNDQKFVSPRQLKELEREGFWELGTNGYRLSYINTYDRYNRFLGELDSREFVEINQYIDRDYNHYLMDYIRDKDRIPVESTEEMEQRITRDYDLMEKIYSDKIGYVPQLYCIMHSNTGRFGDNDHVSRVNAENLEGMFMMNVNREGYSLNNRESSIYDLTRLEPQPWWYTNHLLMRIRDDLPKKDQSNIRFVCGDKDGYSKWNVRKGAAEFKGNLIALTSESESRGIMTLKDKPVRDMKVSCRLLGNKIGCQTIYLRTAGDADEPGGFDSYVSVSLENNVLYVREKTGAEETTLLKQDMYFLHDNHPVSVPEDDQDAYIAELKVRGKYAKDNTIAGLYQLKAFKASREKPQSVADGAEEYVPELQIQDAGDVGIRLTLEGDRLSLIADNITLADHLKISVKNAGGIALESSFGGYQKSQRNIADDVYDAVYQDFSVKTPDGSDTIYDYTYHGLGRIGHEAGAIWNQVVNWVIENL